MNKTRQAVCYTDEHIKTALARCKGYYFTDSSFCDSDVACSAEDMWEMFRDSDEQAVILWAAKSEYNTGFFYCAEYAQMGEVGEGCGKECFAYKPKNGVKGVCSHFKVPMGRREHGILMHKFGVMGKIGVIICKF